MQNSEAPKSVWSRVLARIARFIRKRIRKWRERHRHPFNWGMHIIGIPLAVAGVVCWFNGAWLWGLGLFVTRKLVAEHGGSVDFESSPGRGTVFHVRLPVPDKVRW